ncbi:MAG TPA: alpha/beta fold hydrolase [Nitriliruptorales bacterium]|nr:alpha/beta fold hydrolase [Nitriliruptorales bacterium]
MRATSTRRFPLIHGAEEWSSSGPDSDVGVIVVHGFTTNPVSTRPLGEAIAAHGYAVEVPRLPGHGTHWRDLARTRYTHWRSKVEATFDDLAARCRAVVLVGHSLGGTISLDIAARRCRTGRAKPLAGVAVINAQVLDRTDPLARANVVLQHLIPAAPRQLAGLPPNDIARPGADERAYMMVPAKAGYSVQRELPRIRRSLPEITVPVLVAWSPQDHTVPPRNSRAIVKLVGTSDVGELRLDRCYHVAQLDHEADLLADRIVAFVARVTASESEASAGR